MLGNTDEEKYSWDAASLVRSGLIKNIKIFDMIVRKIYLSREESIKGII